MPSFDPADLLAEQLRRHPVASPPPGPHECVSFDQAAARGEDQRQRQVGGRRIEHSGRIGDRDAASAARLDVDGVVADPVVGDQAQSREEIENAVVDDLADHDQRVDRRAFAVESLVVLDIAPARPTLDRGTAATRGSS